MVISGCESPMASSSKDIYHFACVGREHSSPSPEVWESVELLRFNKKGRAGGREWEWKGPVKVCCRGPSTQLQSSSCQLRSNGDTHVCLTGPEGYRVRTENIIE